MFGKIVTQKPRAICTTMVPKGGIDSYNERPNLDAKTTNADIEQQPLLSVYCCIKIAQLLQSSKLILYVIKSLSLAG